MPLQGWYPYSLWGKMGKNRVLRGCQILCRLERTVDQRVDAVFRPIRESDALQSDGRGVHPGFAHADPEAGQVYGRSSQRYLH